MNRQNKLAEISVYNIIDKYDFLLTPIADSVVGAVGFGLPGFIGGIVIGTIDEILINLGYTNSRYLSPIIQGATSLATLTSSWCIKGIGGILGLLFFQIIIKDNSEYLEKIIVPTQTALQGGYVFGLKGVLWGLFFGSIEEIFIHYKFYDKHYISSTISYISITHLFKEKAGVALIQLGNENLKLDFIFKTLNKLGEKNQYILESLVGIFSIVKTFYEIEKKNNITILEIKRETKEIYKKLGRELEYNNMLEKQILTSSGFAVVEQFLYFKLMGCIQKKNEGFYGDLTNIQVWNNFQVHLKEIFKVLPWLGIIKQIFISPFEAYFNFKAQNQLYDAVSSYWLIDEVPLKILHKENTEVLIDNLNKDIATITNSGEGLRKSFLTDIIKNGYSQYLMYQYNAQDLIVFYQIYYYYTQYISEILSKWMLSYNDEIRDLESKKNSIIKHDARNIETVVERNGINYSEMVLKEINEDIKTVTVKQLLLTHLCDTWKEIEIYTDIIFTYYSIGYKSHIKELHPDSRLKVLSATGSIASLMSWKGKNAKTIDEVGNSLKKLNIFIDKIKESSSSNLEQLHYVKGINKELVFQDLELMVNEKRLFYIQNIDLKFGLYYALTGNSGSGKSSFFLK